MTTLGKLAYIFMAKPKFEALITTRENGKALVRFLDVGVSHSIATVVRSRSHSGDVADVSDKQASALRCALSFYSM